MHTHTHSHPTHTLSHTPPHTLSHTQCTYTLTHSLLNICAYVHTLNFLYSFIPSAEHSRACPMPVTGTAKTPMGWALAPPVTWMVPSLTVTTCHPDETWSLLTGPASSLVAQSGLQRPPPPPVTFDLQQQAVFMNCLLLSLVSHCSTWQYPRKSQSALVG